MLQKILIAFIICFIIFLLWNWLMPIVFRLPQIDYFQAIGLYIMSNLLFKRTSSH